MTATQQGSYSTAATAQQLQRSSCCMVSKALVSLCSQGNSPAACPASWPEAVAAAFAAAQASAYLEGNVIMDRRMDSKKLVAELVAELVRAPGWAWSGMGI